VFIILLGTPEKFSATV